MKNHEIMMNKYIEKVGMAKQGILDMNRMLSEREEKY